MKGMLPCLESDIFDGKLPKDIDQTFLSFGIDLKFIVNSLRIKMEDHENYVVGTDSQIIMNRLLLFNNKQSSSHFNQQQEQESASIKSEEDDNKNHQTYHDPDPEDYFEMDIQSVQDSLMMEVKEQKSNIIITDEDINNVDTKNIPYNKGKKKYAFKK